MLLIEIFYELMKIVVSRKNNNGKLVTCFFSFTYVHQENKTTEPTDTQEQINNEENKKDEHSQNGPDVSTIHSDSSNKEFSRDNQGVPSPIPHTSTPPLAQYVSTPPLPSPSRYHQPKPQQHVFAKNIPRMPSPIKTLRDSGSSLSSAGPSSSSPTLSSSRNHDRIRAGGVGSPRSPGGTRREMHREDEGGNENADSNVMFTPPSKASIIPRSLLSMIVF